MRITNSVPVFVTLVTLCCAEIRAENWDRFRGPNGAGQSDAAGIPTEWTEADYLWKKPLPGIGHSSPVIWGDRLFVSSADPATAEQIILAFDAHTGEQIWEKRFDSATYSQHADNSYATSTPAVDADHLYLAWLAGKTVTLAALTHDGEEVWRREVGTLVENHGFGTSPIVIDDVVCLANENPSAANSVVVALDRNTGEIRWEEPRGTGKTAFATPFVLETGARRKLLITASMGTGVTAFDPATGAIAWQVLEHDLPDRCVSSPIAAAGLVLVSCGSGNNGMHLIAIRPTDNGDPPQEVYRLRQGVPNIPTPVLAGDLLFLWHDRGTVSCIDASTGKEHWRERIGGHFHSSPVRIGDRIFGLSKDGEVVVLAASKEFRLLARNSLGETCQATPAVANERIYYRTESSLICIGPSARN